MDTIQSTNSQKPVLTILRWLLFLPSALAAAVIAQFLTAIGNKFTMQFVSVEPESLLGKIWLLFISNAVFGVVLVFVGAYVAPKHKKIVAFSIAGLLLIATGAVIILSLMADRYWDILAAFANNIGAIGMAVLIFKGEVDTILKL